MEIFVEDFKKAQRIFKELTGLDFNPRDSIEGLLECLVMSNCVIYIRQLKHHAKEDKLL